MNIQSVQIRQATMDDAGPLRALIEHSVRRLQRNDYSMRQIEGALGYAMGLDTQLILDGTYFVAEDEDSQAAGCGGWSRRRTLFGSDNGPNRSPVRSPAQSSAQSEDPTADLLDPAVDAAKIRAIFVHPDWARRGLGSKILLHCEREAQAAGFHRVEMGSTLTGVPLYTLKGYRERERIELPLPNGEILPLVRMTKPLTRQSSAACG